MLVRPTVTTCIRKRFRRTWTLEMCICGRLTEDGEEEEESGFPWWYSPQTFASSLGPGSERECWRHVTFLAAASLKSLSAGAGAAESPLFASRHLSAGGKQTQRRHKLLISCHSVLYLLVLQYERGVGGSHGWLTYSASVIFQSGKKAKAINSRWLIVSNLRLCITNPLINLLHLALEQQGRLKALTKRRGYRSYRALTCLD